MAGKWHVNLSTFSDFSCNILPSVISSILVLLQYTKQCKNTISIKQNRQPMGYRTFNSNAASCSRERYSIHSTDLECLASFIWVLCSCQYLWITER